MDPIEEGDEESMSSQGSDSSSPRVIENKNMQKQSLKNTKVKHSVNVQFTNCSFDSVIFATLSRCKFTGCEFKGCAFSNDLKNVKFIQCKHHESNFTQILLVDCLFEKTQLSSVISMATTFDNCRFIDGEYSSHKTQQCKFLNTHLIRFNIMCSTQVENSTFTGCKFDTLTMRQVSFTDTHFKNCALTSVNQTQSSLLRCEFPYTSLYRCSLTDNKFIRCKYDHFDIKHSNVLRNSFEGSSMNHTKLERTNFSYNNMSSGSFYNINFTFCTTRDNNKKDAVFCNSEMLTSTKLNVTGLFNKDFSYVDSYQYCVKLVATNGGQMVLPDQTLTVQKDAPSVTFLVSYDLLNLAVMIQIEKTSNSTFGSIFNYSASNEEVFKEICIDNKVYLPGRKTINGKTYFGFIAPNARRKIRSKSL